MFIPSSVQSCGAFDFIYEEKKLGFENLTVFFESVSINYSDTVKSPESLNLVKYALGIKPADVFDDDLCVYQKKNGAFEVVTIKNIPGNITIPATYNNLPVSKINSYALYGDTLTTHVYISEGIKKISEKAFCNSSNLQIVIIPESVTIVNYRGFYNTNYCTVYIEAEAIPTDWDSSWYSGLKNYYLNTKINSSGAYLYKITEGKVYLVKYIEPISKGDLLIIPEQIDGLPVYGICSDCYTVPQETKIVVPRSITVMEANAIYANSYSYGCTLYLKFAESKEIPSTWHSNWFYTNYGYRYNGSYNTVFYSSQWELVNNIPVLKNNF